MATDVDVDTQSARLGNGKSKRTRHWRYLSFHEHVRSGSRDENSGRGRKRRAM